MMRRNNSVDLSLFLLIAKIGKTRGLKGEFFLRSYAQNPETLFSFKKFYALSRSAMEEVHFEFMRVSNSNIVAKLKSINEIDEIKAYGQRDIFVLKSELPKLDDNEAYWFELEGMLVTNLEGQHLGHIQGVNNFGASDVLEIKPLNKKIKNILIPFIKNRVIISIDKSNNSILVDWQEDY
ncbi:ribosome maturation factor RimM [Gammaproteobacteria bacterium]|jgi:16S rRNA processing protein RimM|nr:ribosome maturation factor RimM [Gammaproteobacteria bacterium]